MAFIVWLLHNLLQPRGAANFQAVSWGTGKAGLIGFEPVEFMWSADCRLPAGHGANFVILHQLPINSRSWRLTFVTPFQSCRRFFIELAGPAQRGTVIVMVCLSVSVLRPSVCKGKCIAVCETSPHRYGKSLTIWNHTVLPATRQRWLSRLYPSRSWYSI